LATGTVLITGAAGFIGSHVSEALLLRGRRVVGVDNLDPFYDESLKRANLAEIEKVAGGAPGNFVFERADIRDEAAMRRVFEAHKPETVIHLAAKAGVRPSIAEPGLYAHVNVVGTTVVFEAARRGHAFN
jgi:UDP-glucuronate 4-epimerase